MTRIIPAAFVVGLSFMWALCAVLNYVNEDHIPDSLWADLIVRLLGFFACASIVTIFVLAVAMFVSVCVEGPKTTIEKHNKEST